MGGPGICRSRNHVLVLLTIAATTMNPNTYSNKIIDENAILFVFDGRDKYLK